LKKLIAATLLSIYLFNIGGQFVMHQYFVYLSDKLFNEQAGKGRYNVNDLTEIKLPVNLPGITEWNSYENIIGQVIFANSTYNYVKMRITRTALYLMCVPDYAATNFSGQNIINAKQVKDMPVSPKEHVPYGKTTLMGSFNIEFTQFIFSSPFKSPVITAVQSCPQLVRHSPDIPEQPPKFSC
jgi:hypothetical protein